MYDKVARRKRFGERLRSLRTSRNLTLEQLGKIIGMALSTVHTYEAGQKEPDMTNLCKLADYFGVTLDFLMCRYDDMESIKAEDLPPELQALGIDEIKINKLSTQELQQELSELSNYADKINKILKHLGK